MTTPNDIRVQIRERIDQLLAEGFDPPDAIRESVIEGVTDPDGNGPLRIGPLVDEAFAAAMAARAIAQRSWPAVTDCDRLDAAFEELNAAGIMARHNWTCCGTCGAAEMPDEFDRLGGRWQDVPIVGYAFYHMQDVESAVDGFGICLDYGSTEPAPDEAAYERQCLLVAERVRETLERHGLTVEWNGTYEKRIAVPMDWKRRLAPPRFCET